MSGSAQHAALYRELIRCLATALRSDFALIGIVDETGKRVVPIAVLDEDDPNRFAYDTKETPCEIALREGPLIIRSGVTARFPTDKILTQLGAQAYLAHPFEDPITGRSGIIAAIRRAPIENEDEIGPILSAFVESILTARLAQIMHADNVQLSLALDSAEVGFAVVDRSGVFVRGNERARSFFRPRDDGSHVLSPPCGVKDSFRHLLGAIAGRRRWSGRFEMPNSCDLSWAESAERQDSGALVIEAEVTPLFRGHEDRSAVTLRDCTAEARREDRLRRDATEQRVYASVLDALQRRDPIEDRARDAASAILEFPEYLSMRVVRFVEGRVVEIAAVPVGHEPVVEIEDAALIGLASKLELHAEAELPGSRDASGNRAGIPTCLTPIRHQGRDIGAMVYQAFPGYRCDHRLRVMPRMIEEMFANAIVRDELEHGLREALTEARQAALAKNQFLANMSHELRTPINAILGFAEMLELDAQRDAPTPPDQIRGIQRNAASLLSMVSDILDLGKFEPGAPSMKREPCSVESICGRVIDRFSEAAIEKGLTLYADCEGLDGLTVYTDPAMVDQVLGHIVANAIKFTNEGGVSVTITREDEAGRVRFAVADTGIGIKAGRVEHLFEPFVQLDASYSRRHGGVGLGLAVCRDLVARLGGSIEVSSWPGDGSVFIFTLPQRFTDLNEVGAGDCGPRPASSTRDDARSWGRAALGGRRVLVVEDGSDNRTLFDFYLRRVGVTPVFAENGREAIDIVCRESTNGGFDLIVMDVQMPVLDGIETTVKLRRSGVTTPILAVTAHAMDSDRDRCLAVGCDGYLTKPVNFERFIEVCVGLVEPGHQDAA